MQTFLPYEDFERTAVVLDRLRLGKQRVETLQVMNASARLSGPSAQNHPIALAWKGHESWLLGYQSAIVYEWTGRGYADTCYEKTQEAFFALVGARRYRSDPRPEWLGDDEFHRAYRALLIRKDPEIYLPLFPDVTFSDAEATHDPWALVARLTGATS